MIRERDKPGIDGEDMNKTDFQVESFVHDERSTQFSVDGCCDTLTSSDYKQPIVVAYAIENHPADSRVTMSDDGIVQTLSARCGTGGGNTPLVMLRSVQSSAGKSDKD